MRHSVVHSLILRHELFPERMYLLRRLLSYRWLVRALQLRRFQGGAAMLLLPVCSRLEALERLSESNH